MMVKVGYECVGRGDSYVGAWSTGSAGDPQEHHLTEPSALTTAHISIVYITHTNGQKKKTHTHMDT